MWAAYPRNPKLYVELQQGKPTDKNLQILTVSQKDQDIQGFYFGSRLQKQRPNPEKLSWVRVPVKIVSVARKLRTIEEEQRQNQTCYFGYYIAGTKEEPPENCSKFESRRRFHLLNIFTVKWKGD
jgi:hypothetical protein